MRFRPFIPQDEIEETQVNQKELYPDANNVEDADILHENLPATQEDTIDEEPEEQTTEINHQTESPTFFDVYAPEVIAQRTSIKCDTPLGMHTQSLTRTQHPPMERDDNNNEREIKMVWISDGLKLCWIENVMCWNWYGLKLRLVEYVMGWNCDGLKLWWVEKMMGWKCDWLKLWWVEFVMRWSCYGLKLLWVEFVMGWIFHGLKL